MEKLLWTAPFYTNFELGIGSKHVKVINSWRAFKLIQLYSVSIIYLGQSRQDQFVIN